MVGHPPPVKYTGAILPRLLVYYTCFRIELKTIFALIDKGLFHVSLNIYKMYITKQAVRAEFTQIKHWNSKFCIFLTDVNTYVLPHQTDILFGVFFLGGRGQIKLDVEMSLSAIGISNLQDFVD